MTNIRKVQPNLIPLKANNDHHRLANTGMKNECETTEIYHLRATNQRRNAVRCVCIITVTSVVTLSPNCMGVTTNRCVHKGRLHWIRAPSDLQSSTLYNECVNIDPAQNLFLVLIPGGVNICKYGLWFHPFISKRVKVENGHSVMDTHLRAYLNIYLHPASIYLPTYLSRSVETPTVCFYIHLSTHPPICLCACMYAYAYPVYNCIGTFQHFVILKC